jgi:ABC-type dipeptide/oligopeptide/nickel transport system ATPase component
LLITHNFGVVSELCEQIAVFYLGKITETGPAEVLLRFPAHPYTRAAIRGPRSRRGRAPQQGQ